MGKQERVSGSVKAAVLTTRVSSETMQRIDALCAKAKLTRSALLDRLLRESLATPFETQLLADGVVSEEAREVIDAVDDAALQLQRIGNNVNQLAKVANASGSLPTEAALEAVRDALEAIDVSLEKVVKQHG